MATDSTPRPIDWASYNRALVERGSLTVWIDEAALAAWHAGPTPGKVGRKFVYADSAIEMVLTLRSVFNLTLRAAQGYATSILALMGVALPVPHYSTLSRRAARLAVDLQAAPASGPVTLVIDSTGLKVYGEGEWKVRQHGYSKRRTWRKLHLAVDPNTHQVVGATLTEARVDDASQVGELLDQAAKSGAEVEGFTADGAYDKAKVYKQAEAHGAKPTVPPRRGAKVWKHGNLKGPKHPRDEALRDIRRRGRRAWKRASGYHRRSLAETAMFRYKELIGRRLRNRTLAAQATEAKLGCKILNRLIGLGMPKPVS